MCNSWDQRKRHSLACILLKGAESNTDQEGKKRQKTSNVCHTTPLSSQYCRCKRLGQCIPHSHKGWCSWLDGKLWNDETTQKQGRHTIVANRSKPAANTRAIGISNTDSIVLTSIRTESYIKEVTYHMIDLLHEKLQPSKPFFVKKNNPPPHIWIGQHNVIIGDTEHINSFKDCATQKRNLITAKYDLASHKWSQCSQSEFWSKRRINPPHL